MRKTVILIRHAEAIGQAPTADLTRTGHEQAKSLAHRLGSMNIDAVFCSPFRRAQATIEPFVQASGLPINTLSNLRERCLAPQPLADWKVHIARSFENGDYALPGGESLNQSRQRGLKALPDIFSSAARCPVAVSHGNLIAATLHHVDPNFGFDSWRAMANPELYKITLQRGLPQQFTHIG